MDQPEDQYSYGAFHITNTLHHSDGDHSQHSTQLHGKTPQMSDKSKFSDKGVHEEYDYSLEISESNTTGHHQGE